MKWLGFGGPLSLASARRTIHTEGIITVQADERALGQVFLDAWPGTLGREDASAVQQMLELALERARRHWPQVQVDAGRLAAYLGERAPLDVPAAEACRTARVEDLYLACACAASDPAALEAFDTRFLSQVARYLAQLKLSPTLVDEATQALRMRLFLEGQDGAGKIERYRGLGPLEAWVRVAAVRVALNLQASLGTPAASSDTLRTSTILPVGVDAEVDYLRGRYRDDVKLAFREALQAMGARERTILRYRYLDGLVPEGVARIYGVHRTTAGRWLSDAQEALLAGLRQRLGARLSTSASECDSILAMVRSTLEVTLGPLLQEP
jgi:RNA polymerase sigma-70 factor, ECF subfamily